MPLVNREATAKLREIIRRPGSVILPGGVLPIQAVLAQHAGYEVFHVSGGWYHQWFLGIPDSGLWTTTEFIEYARKVVDSVTIPVIVDLDVSGGHPMNIFRTVQDVIRTGAAGCHIEDVQYPKGITRSGLNWNPLRGARYGKLLVSVEEQIGRLKAAMAARDELDPDFVIIARTDARGSHGGSVELAIERAQAYADAGPDMIMFEGMRNWDESARALASSRLPAFTSGRASQYPTDENGTPIPLPTVEERTAAGEKFLLWVGLGWEGATQTAWDELTAVKRDGFGVVDEWRAQQARRPASELVPAFRVEYMERLMEIQEACLPGPPSDDGETSGNATTA
jgi:2-methylisocitrate lyase-like PEP mutase family enzyme